MARRKVAAIHWGILENENEKGCCGTTRSLLNKPTVSCGIPTVLRGAGTTLN